MRHPRRIVQGWELVTAELAESFVDYYFDCDTEEYWVGDEVGGIYHVNDYFFSLEDMVQFMRHDYPVDKMFEYYQYSLEQDGKPPININNYLKLK